MEKAAKKKKKAAPRKFRSASARARVHEGGLQRIGKKGRRRKAMVQVKLFDAERDTVHALARTHEGKFGPWGASEYIRALVTLDGVGAVDWSKLPPPPVGGSDDEGGEDDES